MKASIDRGDGPRRLLILVVSVLVGSFVVATLVAQRMSSEVARLSESLVHQAMPRIEHVASVRDATLEVQLAVTDLVHGTGRGAARELLDTKLATLQQVVRTNLVAANLPGERVLSTEVDQALRRFETAVSRVRDAAERNDSSARALFHAEVLPAANYLGDRAMREIELNAQRGQQIALQIKATRWRIIWLSYAVIATCIVAAAAGMITLRRSSGRRLERLGEYARQQESKAGEMEQFAGRVAHDIRGPLTTATLTTEMLDNQLVDPGLRSHVARLQRSLTRAASITDGLLEFARAGASPEPGARANVHDVIEDIADGLAPELGRTAIELDIESAPSVLVACSTGVLSSIVGNLVRNAAKYMGDSTERNIAIRGLDRGAMIRVEVADTGPGIAPDIVPRLFEPYFRGATHNQTGLGLGLSTVRRLVERHGGRIGVSSEVGLGSTFWFELPFAGAAIEASQHEEDPPARV